MTFNLGRVEYLLTVGFHLPSTLGRYQIPLPILLSNVDDDDEDDNEYSASENTYLPTWQYNSEGETENGVYCLPILSLRCAEVRLVAFGASWLRTFLFRQCFE